MVWVGVVLLVVGAIIEIVGLIRFLMAAFGESILWGLGTLLVPFVGLIFLFMHSDKALRPFIWMVLGGVLAGIGAAISGTSMGGMVGAG
jgi:hypothetical protein